MNNFRSILSLSLRISLILLKNIQSKCPVVEEWRQFKSKYDISFYNSTFQFES